MAVKCVQVSVSIVSTMMVAHCEVWVPLCSCSVYCGIVTQCLLGSVPVWNCYAMPHNGCSEEWSLLLGLGSGTPSASWNSFPVNLATHQGALQSNTLNIIIINNSIVTLIITTIIIIITNIINMVMIRWGKRAIKWKKYFGSYQSLLLKAWVTSLSKFRNDWVTLLYNLKGSLVLFFSILRWSEVDNEKEKIEKKICKYLWHLKQFGRRVDH